MIQNYKPSLMKWNLLAQDKKKLDINVYIFEWHEKQFFCRILHRSTHIKWRRL